MQYLERSAHRKDFLWDPDVRFLSCIELTNSAGVAEGLEGAWFFGTVVD